MNKKGGLDGYVLEFEELTSTKRYYPPPKAVRLARRGVTKLRTTLHGVLPGKGVHGDDRKVK